MVPNKHTINPTPDLIVFAENPLWNDVYLQQGSLGLDLGATERKQRGKGRKHLGLAHGSF